MQDLKYYLEEEIKKNSRSLNGPAFPVLYKPKLIMTYAYLNVPAIL
jgi:hypothetical protein